MLLGFHPTFVPVFLLYFLILALFSCYVYTLRLLSLCFVLALFMLCSYFLLCFLILALFSCSVYTLCLLSLCFVPVFLFLLCFFFIHSLFILCFCFVHSLFLLYFLFSPYSNHSLSILALMTLLFFPETLLTLL